MRIDDGITIWELIEHRAAADPDGVFVLDELGREFTFGEYHDVTLRAAAGLHEHGVRAGDTVGWQLPTWIESFVLMGALARIGVRQMPLLPIYRESELTHLLPLAEARFWCLPTGWRGRDYTALHAAVSREVPGIRPLWCDRTLPDADPTALAAPPVDGRAATWIFPTSGTTSAPKGVLHSDLSIICGARDLSSRLGMRAEDRYGIAFPLTHIGGAVNLVGALIGGYSLAVTESFEPAATTATFREQDVTVVGGGPAFYAGFLGEQRRDLTGPVLPRLRFMTGGGAPMPPQLHAEVREGIGGLGVAHGYGMTEACVVTMNAPGDEDDRLAYSVGRPVDHVELVVTGPDGTPLPTGQSGELRIRGQAVTIGYLGTDGHFDSAGRLRTGDLGHVDADGYVYITGRLKDVIIRKGENVSAAAVETVLNSCPTVSEAAVIGLPDDDRGELVCAVVIPAPAAAPTLADLTAHCSAAGLMRQCLPERLELVESLPRNASGKVLKAELRERFTGATVRSRW